MQAKARLKHLLMSPRKVRRVVTLIKGKSVEEALNILKFTNKAAAIPLSKTIQSATANALAEEGTSRLKAEDLSISRIFVDEGPRAKRIEFRAMGRANRYVRRFSHITVVVEGQPEEEAVTKKKSTRKATTRAKSETEKTETKKKVAKKPAKKPAKKTAPRSTKATKKTTGKTKTKKTTAAKKTTAKKSVTKKAKTAKAAKKDK